MMKPTADINPAGDAVRLPLSELIDRYFTVRNIVLNYVYTIAISVPIAVFLFLTHPRHNFS
jgi:hypothetical protein